MSALSRFPAFSYVSSHKLCALPLPSVAADHALLHRRRLPTISASSVRKPRASRKVMNDADLCTDIQEFLRVVGHPAGHVPSVKELSQHGRQDLANIVRRRGYKFMKQLLAASTESGGEGSDAAEGLIDKKDVSGEHELESTGQDEKVEAAEMLLTIEVPVKQNHLNSADGAKIDHASISESESCMDAESSTNLSLQKKVAKFVQDGELDAIEGDDKDFFELEDSTKESCSLGEEHSGLVLDQSHNGVILNRNVLPNMQVVLPASESNAPRNDQSSSEGPLSAGCDEQLDVETSKSENQIEVNHLKLVLDQKELELSRLKEQIEQEKLALSVLQTKAETEISKAQKLILEKDAELQAVEEGLSGLKEVQIHYQGEGETVEVTGSFNGWQDRITMDPQLSSSILDSIGSRGSRLWTATLWLYPGKYEIKFIVDGQWRIDPQKESVTRGTIQNNILNVGR